MKNPIKIRFNQITNLLKLTFLKISLNWTKWITPMFLGEVISVVIKSLNRVDLLSYIKKQIKTFVGILVKLIDWPV